MIDAQVAEALDWLQLEGEPKVISTRVGPVKGHLVRVPIALAADEGESVELDATVFVSSAWTHGTFLGYLGFLERLRFALDPQDYSFFFGGYDE